MALVACPASGMRRGVGAAGRLIFNFDFYSFAARLISVGRVAAWLDYCTSFFTPFRFWISPAGLGEVAFWRFEKGGRRVAWAWSSPRLRLTSSARLGLSMRCQLECGLGVAYGTGGPWCGAEWRLDIGHSEFESVIRLE